MAGLGAWIAARMWPLLAGAGLLAVIAVQTARIEGVDLGLITLEGFKPKSERLARELVDAKAATKKAEDLRAQERQQDQGSFDAQAQRCEAQAAQMLEAAQTIHEVINAQPIAPAADGGRDIIGAGQLRRVIGSPAAGAPAGLPTGSDGRPRQ